MVAAGFLGIVIGAIGSGTAVKTQDRGAAVLITNTRGEPVPTEVVSNGPTQPLFVAPVLGRFDVCPVSCGAFQTTANAQGETAVFDVPPGMRFIIRHISLSMRSPAGAKVYGARLLTRFLASGGALVTQEISLPAESRILSLLEVHHASLPALVYHDSVDPNGQLAIAMNRYGLHTDVLFISASVSGTLEPLPQQ